MPLLKKGTGARPSCMVTQGCICIIAILALICLQEAQRLRLIDAGTGAEINILQICSTKSTKAKTPKAKAQSKAYNPFDDNEVPTPVSVDELMARRPGKGADNPFVEADAEDDPAPNEHEPKLDLPQLQTGLVLSLSRCCSEAALYPGCMTVIATLRLLCIEHCSGLHYSLWLENLRLNNTAMMLL